MASDLDALQNRLQSYELGQEIPIPEAYKLAVRCHQAGMVEQAARMYRHILQVDSGNAHLRYLLGAACQALGRLDEAAARLEESSRIRPGFADVHNHLGLVRALQGKFAAAEACFVEALRLKPDYAEARENLAWAIKDGERRRQAAQISSGARPVSAEDWNNAGAAQVSEGKLEAAFNSFREAILLQPDLAEAHTNLGGLLRQQGRFDEAIAALRRAVQHRPDMFEARFGLGDALRERGLLEEAAASYQEAVRLRPTDVGARSNLAGTLLALGRLEAALAADREVIQLQPGVAEAHNNLGAVLAALGRLDEALECFAEAIRLKPDYAEPHKARAIVWLLQGDLARGWPEYEWRLRCSEAPPLLPEPQWDGSPLQGRTILLSTEQGMGDSLQFIRYVALVRKRGGRVIVMCPRSLHRLLRRSLEIDQLLGPGDELPAFDTHAALLSLPALLGTTLATIPAEVPYLRTDDDVVERWRHELGPVDGFKIGIAWQGRTEHKGDRLRSVPLQAFAPLAALDGIRLISLQKGPGTDQISRLPEDWTIIDAGSRVEDWADTAGLLKNLDLVVTVDTAVAHLAGALGMPVWVALPFAPDWRWLLGREGSPWYPSMRLFRQSERGNWAEVFAGIAAAAATLLDRAGRCP
jgi:tetratricopeptide (TPR) repeat protein